MTIQYQTALAPSVTERDHVHGPDSAPLTLVQFGDYACPYCQEAHANVQQIVGELKEEVRFVYRHFPVSSPSRSRRAAEAAEAASAQGRFWEMHDLLSREGGVHLTEERLTALAKQLKLDLARFHSELQSHVHYDRIEEDMESARQSEVGTTPTFFLNGEYYDGPLSAEALRGAR